MLNKTLFYYFSPTGGTMKIGEFFCKNISEESVQVNLALHNREFEASGADLAVFAVPVIGGRVPAYVSDKLSQLKSNKINAVTIVVYGNRAYDDALLELNDVVSSRGFNIVASAALVAQHSIVNEIAKGRPDAKNLEEIKKFAEEVLNKISNCNSSTPAVPGNRPYKDHMVAPATPISIDTCNGCGKCVKSCPTDAIKQEGKSILTDKDKCFMCLACTKACPNGSRILPPQVFEKTSRMLAPFKTIRRENEFYL